MTENFSEAKKKKKMADFSSSSLFTASSYAKVGSEQKSASDFVMWSLKNGLISDLSPSSE